MAHCEANSLRHAAFTVSSTGDNDLIAAVTGKKIRVYELQYFSDGTTSVKLKDGASTDLTKNMPVVANGSNGFANNGYAHFETAPGNAFVINQSGTANLSGYVKYVLV
jgi:hypothetical protein